MKKRRKHIFNFNSFMSYNGVIFDKQSKEITGRNPFKEDRNAVDYDLDSEDEWHELHCDDLENDQLLIEEDSELNGDDPELRQEGFIVPDDYLSQTSYDGDEDDHASRKELLKKYLER